MSKWCHPNLKTSILNTSCHDKIYKQSLCLQRKTYQCSQCIHSNQQNTKSNQDPYNQNIDQNHRHLFHIRLCNFYILSSLQSISYTGSFHNYCTDCLHYLRRNLKNKINTLQEFNRHKYRSFLQYSPNNQSLGLNHILCYIKYSRGSFKNIIGSLFCHNYCTNRLHCLLRNLGNKINTFQEFKLHKYRSFLRHIPNNYYFRLNNILYYIEYIRGSFKNIIGSLFSHNYCTDRLHYLLRILRNKINTFQEFNLHKYHSFLQYRWNNQSLSLNHILYYIEYSRGSQKNIIGNLFCHNYCTDRLHYLLHNLRNKINIFQEFNRHKYHSFLRYNLSNQSLSLNHILYYIEYIRGSFKNIIGSLFSHNYCTNRLHYLLRILRNKISTFQEFNRHNYRSFLRYNLSNQSLSLNHILYYIEYSRGSFKNIIGSLFCHNYCTNRLHYLLRILRNKINTFQEFNLHKYRSFLQYRWNNQSLSLNHILYYIEYIGGSFKNIIGSLFSHNYCTDRLHCLLHNLRNKINTFQEFNLHKYHSFLRYNLSNQSLSLNHILYYIEYSRGSQKNIIGNLFCHNYCTDRLHYLLHNLRNKINIFQEFNRHKYHSFLRYNLSNQSLSLNHILYYIEYIGGSFKNIIGNLFSHNYCTNRLHCLLRILRNKISTFQEFNRHKYRSFLRYNLSNQSLSLNHILYYIEYIGGSFKNIIGSLFCHNYCTNRLHYLLRILRNKINTFQEFNLHKYRSFLQYRWNNQSLSLNHILYYIEYIGGSFKNIIGSLFSHNYCTDRLHYLLRILRNKINTFQEFILHKYRSFLRYIPNIHYFRLNNILYYIEYIRGSFKNIIDSLYRYNYCTDCFNYSHRNLGNKTNTLQEFNRHKYHSFLRHIPNNHYFRLNNILYYIEYIRGNQKNIIDSLYRYNYCTNCLHYLLHNLRNKTNTLQEFNLHKYRSFLRYSPNKHCLRLNHILYYIEYIRGSLKNIIDNSYRYNYCTVCFNYSHRNLGNKTNTLQEFNLHKYRSFLRYSPSNQSLSLNHILYYIEYIRGSFKNIIGSLFCHNYCTDRLHYLLRNLRSKINTFQEFNRHKYRSFLQYMSNNQSLSLNHILYYIEYIRGSFKNIIGNLFCHNYCTDRLHYLLRILRNKTSTFQEFNRHKYRSFLRYRSNNQSLSLNHILYYIEYIRGSFKNIIGSLFSHNYCTDRLHYLIHNLRNKISTFQEFNLHKYRSFLQYNLNNQSLSLNHILYYIEYIRGSFKNIIGSLFSHNFCTDRLHYLIHNLRNKISTFQEFNRHKYRSFLQYNLNNQSLSLNHILYYIEYIRGSFKNIIGSLFSHNFCTDRLHCLLRIFRNKISTFQEFNLHKYRSFLLYMSNNQSLSLNHILYYIEYIRGSFKNIIGSLFCHNYCTDRLHYLLRNLRSKINIFQEFNRHKYRSFLQYNLNNQSLSLNHILYYIEYIRGSQKNIIGSLFSHNYCTDRLHYLIHNLGNKINIFQEFNRHKYRSFLRYMSNNQSLSLNHILYYIEYIRGSFKNIIDSLFCHNYCTDRLHYLIHNLRNKISTFQEFNRHKYHSFLQYNLNNQSLSLNHILYYIEYIRGSFKNIIGSLFSHNYCTDRLHYLIHNLRNKISTFQEFNLHKYRSFLRYNLSNQSLGLNHILYYIEYIRGSQKNIIGNLFSHNFCTDRLHYLLRIFRNKISTFQEFNLHKYRSFLRYRSNNQSLSLNHILYYIEYIRGSLKNIINSSNRYNYCTDRLHYLLHNLRNKISTFQEFNLHKYRSLLRYSPSNQSLSLNHILYYIGYS